MSQRRRQPGLHHEAPEFQRIWRIAQEHILISIRRSEMVRDVAARLGVSPEAATAYAIADQVFEEFRVSPREA